MGSINLLTRTLRKHGNQTKETDMSQNVHENESTSMRQGIFYLLVRNLQKDNRLIHVGEFAYQKVDMPEMGLKTEISYECSARLSTMNKDNPDLLERDWLPNKTNNKKSYGYRLATPFVESNIKDKDLLEVFYALEKPEVYAKQMQEEAEAVINKHTIVL